MANNTRDVTLRILVDTLGQDGVDKLRVALDALGKQGGESALEAKSLVDQLDRLTAQGAAVQALQQLSTEVDQLTAQEVAAAAAIEKNSAALVQQRAVLETNRSAQAAAKQALADAQKAYIDTGTAISLLNKEYDAAGKKTDDYKTAIRSLITAQGEQRGAIVDARNALREANNAVSEAVGAQGKLETAQTRAAVAAQAAADAVANETRALQGARQALTELGVDTEDLATAESKLAAAFEDVRLQALQAKTMSDLLAAAQQQLAVETLDAADAERRWAAALEQADVRRAVAETEALADATAALAAEQTFAAETARRQAAAEQEAADAARALQAAQRDEFAKQLAIAQGLLTTELELQAVAAGKAAAADRALAAEQERTAQATRDAAEAAKAAAAQIDNAFATVGTRSVQALQTEIAQVRSAMATLASTGAVTGRALDTAFATGEAKIKGLEREIRQLNGTMTLADKAAGLFKNSLGQIAAGNIIADAVGYLVNKVKELGREFITANVQAETMTRGLTAIYGSSTIAGQQMDFLRKAASSAGISVGQISDSFVRFSAATKSSNISLQVTNDLFTAVTQAGATLGLSGERVTLALDALGQMASKGVVSMEELRQQLGDSLPGALSRAAQGFGITDQQLIKLVESGKLATEDFFPALTKGLQDLRGENDSLSGSWSRLTNVFNTLATTMGESGGLVLLGGLLKTLTAAVGVLGGALLGIVNMLYLVGAAAVSLVASIVTLSNKFGFLKEQVDEAAARQVKFSEAIDAALGKTQAQTVAIQQNADAHGASTSSMLNAAIAQERLGSATTGTAQGYIQQLVRLAENAKAAETATAASEKLAKAKDEEGKAMVQAAQISGNEAKALLAQATASQGSVVASENVVAARLREVEVTQATIAAIEAEGLVRGALSSSQKQLIANSEKTLVTQQAELEKSIQMTEGLRAQAAAAQTAAAAYGDNATRLDAYRQAMESTAATVQSLTETLAVQKQILADLEAGLASGVVTQERYNIAKKAASDTSNELNAANLAASSAERLYRDAVVDTVAALDQKARAAQAAASVELATLKVSQQHYEVLAREADALGATTLAMSYRIDAKQKEMKAVELATRIKMLELEADKAAIEVQIAALDPQDKLYAKKKDELEIRLKLIEVKRIEAGASAEVIRGLQNEITQMTSQLSTRGSNTQSIDRDTGSRYRNRDAINAQTEAMVKQKTTSDGFATNADGSAAGSFNNQLPVDKAFNVLQNGGAGQDFAYLKEALQQAKNAKQILDAMQKQSAGSVSLQAIRDTDALLAATTRAVEAGAGVANRKQSTSSPTTSGESSGSSHTVTINVGGARQTINAASAADAANLTNILKSLGNAAGTAS